MILNGWRAASSLAGAEAGRYSYDASSSERKTVSRPELLPHLQLDELLAELQSRLPVVPAHPVPGRQHHLQPALQFGQQLVELQVRKQLRPAHRVPPNGDAS